ncbi:hypothetical protein QO034_15865 [Sedimentitalea sp. JM2-8]|uniref:Uncharacterized protein n=1 Tax=Sedimentitalea xiamensis TaxID=3050037 RepID=A0ABT7FHG9_9RHOB|nr:hypothetical protein [Sedimentitalea xiamensis]MDK3074572.1 hypothetical protein [Sedimentitalea xiamensis]
MPQDSQHNPMKITCPRDWAGMFFLGGSDIPSGARHVAMPQLSLAVFDPLRTIPVHEATGRQIGIFLGTPVDQRAGTISQDCITLPELPAADLDAFIEKQIYAFTGSFIFVLDIPGAQRIYLDACGSLSAVYEPGTGRAAAISSQLVKSADVEARFDRELYETLRVDRDGWFPAGLTAHHGISRLLPNHYLDLETGMAVRHWPRADIPRTTDPEGACAAILAVTRSTIGAVARSAPVSVALTAGNETRMLLAATHNLPGDFSFVTVAAEGVELDRIRAEELSDRFTLPHRLISLKYADTKGQQDWRARTGFSLGGPHTRTHPTRQQLRDRPYFIGGLGGEIGRAFFWRKTDTDSTPIDAKGIWARMGMPPHPRGIEAISDWLDALRRDSGDLPTLLILDLAYLEIRMGCWGFALSYTYTAPTDIHPLIGRESFAAMLSLPPEWRRMQNGTNLMIQSVIRQGWPELLDLPISRYGDFRDRVGFVRRVRRHPHLVAKKLRKLFG